MSTRSLHDFFCDCSQRMSVHDEDPSSVSHMTSVMSSKGRRFLEVVVLSLYTLLWVTQLIRTPETLQIFESKNYGTLVNITSDTNAQPASSGRITVTNVDPFFERYKAATLISIGVYSSPLSGPFTSSTLSVRDYAQRQYLPVDYHAFLVFETSDGLWWALDKMTDGIYISRGNNHDSVIFYFQGKPRPKPIHMLVKDESSSSVSDLVRRLRILLKSNKYDVIDKNCQHFSKEMFDKFAIDHTWNFTSATDLTSPLTLLRNSGDPLMTCLVCTICIFELYDLFMKGKQNGAYHYKFVTYMVISVSSILFFLNDEQIWLKFDVTLISMFIFIYIVEAVVTAPLAAIRRRGGQYAKMWRSGHIFNKIWLPLCYAGIYTSLIYTFLVFLPLYKIISYLEFLAEDMSDKTSVIFYFLEIATWLFGFFDKTTYSEFVILWYIPTLMYLSLQKI